jgi:hypothetical protein
MLGSWSGKFKSGLLTLVINYVSGNIVSGYDLHKGIHRNVNGQIEEKDGQYALVLKEPGGNPFDGVFYLTMDKTAKQITGTWVPVDSSKIHSGTLTLTRGTEPENDTVERFNDLYYATWQGDLGAISFSKDNTCKLEYYPDSTATDPHPQLVTINGNYIRSSDTLLIDWQTNKRTPAQHMRLIMQPSRQINDSTYIDMNLHGNGVKFTGLLAG